LPDEARLLKQIDAFFGHRAANGTNPDARRRCALLVDKIGFELPKTLCPSAG
jgi:hypothetical protein